MSEWVQRLAAGKDLKSKVAGGAARPNVDPSTTDTDAASADGGSGAGGGSHDVEAHHIPVMDMNSTEMILSLPSVKKGFKRLSLVELRAVLSACGLRNYKQLT